MSNIDETAKTLILNTIQNVFTESTIEEPIVEETPAEKLRREVAEKIAHDLQERKEATKMYKSGDATTSDEKESTIKEKNIKNTIDQIKDKNEDQDFFSAVKICKKKRIGPSRQEDNRILFYKKDIGILARSGFDFEVSRRVMDLDKDEYLKIINLL